MRKKAYYFAILCLVIIGAVIFAACSTEEPETKSEKYLIGVPTYDIKTPQVISFKNYLDTYITGCFPDVEFVYSSSIKNSDEMESFLKYCADNGAKGILALTSYDMQKEISFCDENKMYYVRASGTTADADFEAMSTKEYFIGEIGPGKDIEYSSGTNMVKALAHKGDGNSFLILSGGAALNNEMHRLRTLSMLEALSEIYGISYEVPAEELALSSSVTELSFDEVKLAIVPGYLSNSDNLKNAKAIAASGKYNIGLSVVNVDAILDDDAAGTVSFGVIDFFSDTNLRGFEDGTVCYVSGKYRSEIGPAFAALYNAITGSGDFLRENGKAFRFTQGFWDAANKEEYNEMYGLAAGIEINAYNYEDLYSMIKEYNSGATLESFRALTEAYDFSSCQSRRAG